LSYNNSFLIDDICCNPIPRGANGGKIIGHEGVGFGMQEGPEIAYKFENISPWRFSVAPMMDWTDNSENYHGRLRKTDG
jgi:hypothetical protein